MENLTLMALFLNMIFNVFGEAPVVSTTLGLVSGMEATDGDYNMYLGVPFGRVDPANPFGPASSHPLYQGVFNATDDSAICPQRSRSGIIEGSIDCLHLNVFVPTSANQSNPLPVMAWIYGGGFIGGSFNLASFGPRFLIRHDIIIVTLNYRVGIYGYMCTDHPRVPGNQALRDQMLALRWIHDNIRNFNGDPNKVTIAGQSAGGMNIDLLVAKHSQGPELFQQVILQSGVSFLPSYFNPAKNYPITLAQHLGYQTNNISEALDYLASIEIYDIYTAVTQLGTDFRPCIENEFEGVDGFLTENWVEADVIPAIKNMRAIIGFNDNEGLYHMSSFRGDVPSIVNESLSLSFDIQNDDFNGISAITNFFFADEKVAEEPALQGFLDMRADLSFAYTSLRSLHRYVRSGAEAVYSYVFSYHGRGNSGNYIGAAHGDELPYLFDGSNRGELHDEDMITMDRMTTLWTNFVKYGDPTPQITELLPVKWEAITSPASVHHYLSINNTLVLGNRPFHDRSTFWDLFYEMYGHRHVLNSRR